MAMNVGPASNEDDDDVLSEMNTTPLIDVLLVLLIMLIITIPIQTHAVVLAMPVGSPTPPTPPVVVNIDVDFDGTLIWNGETVDRAGLDARLAAASTTPEQPEIHLKPNRLVDYKYVAGVMASVQHHGLTKLAVIGNDDPAE